MPLTSLKKVIIAIGIITVLHLSLSYYISYILGSKAGNLVVNLIESSMENPSTIEREKAKIDDEMRKARETWQPIMYILSVPLGTVIQPIEHNFFKKYVYSPVLQHRKKWSEVKFRAQAISFTVMAANAFFFSGFVVGLWSLLRKLIIRGRSH